MTRQSATFDEFTINMRLFRCARNDEMLVIRF